MRFDVRRLLGVSALSLIFGLGMASCSGQQQAEDGVEVSEQNGEQGAENQAADNATADSQAGSQGEDVAAGQTTPTEGETGEATANATENDLQEIIQEMNGQPAGNETAGATPAAEAAPAEGGDMAAVPAPAPAPAAEQPAAAEKSADDVAKSAPASAPVASAAMPFQPGGTPAGAGLPEIGSKMAYVVEQGDTLAKISKRIYGTTGRWNELASLSGITNPSRIFPGDVVYYTLDEKAVTFAQAYESTQRMEVQVGKGETLANLAKKFYGSSKAWRSIWRQNDRIDNPDVVPPGTIIYYIPSGSRTANTNKISKTFAKITDKKLYKSQSNEIAKNKITKTKNVHKNKTQHKIIAQQNNLKSYESGFRGDEFRNI